MFNNFLTIINLTFFFFLIANQSSEQDLRKKATISPEDVLSLPKITEGNLYQIFI